MDGQGQAGAGGPQTEKESQLHKPFADVKSAQGGNPFLKPTHDEGAGALVRRNGVNWIHVSLLRALRAFWGCLGFWVPCFRGCRQNGDTFPITAKA